MGESGNAGVDTRYRFTGREWDGESQQYYYRARYYDANMGRFLGQDPLGFAAGDSNLYRYVGNSPAIATDPSGEIIVAAVGLTVVAGLAANMLQPEPAQAPMNARDNHPDPNQVLREAATEVALTGGVGLVKKGAEHGLKRGASTALGKALIKGKDKLFKLGGNAADTLSVLGKDCIDDIAPTISNSWKGNPSAIHRGFGSLNTRQQKLLNELDAIGKTTIVPKKMVSHRDIAALTAQTGDEFALFTRRGQRMLIRGNSEGFSGILGLDEAKSMAAQGWRFSAHTHPIPNNSNPSSVLRSSLGDQLILREFNNGNSAILNSNGQRSLFTHEGDILSGWLP